MRIGTLESQARKCAICGEKATKVVIIDSASSTNMMYYCANHAIDEWRLDRQAPDEGGR